MFKIYPYRCLSKISAEVALKNCWFHSVRHSSAWSKQTLHMILKINVKNSHSFLVHYLCSSNMSDSGWVCCVINL